MNKRIIRFIALFAIIFFGFVGLSSCGNKDNSKTLYETDAYAVQTKINDNKITDYQIDWIEEKVAFIIINNALAKDSITDDEKAALTELKTTLKSSLEEGEENFNALVDQVNGLAEKDEDKAQIKAEIKKLIDEYVYYDKITGKHSEVRHELLKADAERFKTIIDGATDFTMLSTGYLSVDGLTDEEKASVDAKNTTWKNCVSALPSWKKTGCLMGGGSASNKYATDLVDKYRDVETLKDVNVYEALVAYMIEVNTRQTEEVPLFFKLSSFPDFFKYFFNNFFVFPVGLLLHFLTSIFGGWYVIGLFLTTLLIRTAGWPIYAKTNDMSLKMQVLQPEMQKINDKYANRQDPDSQRMKQAEIAQLYKKNKVGLGGCFLPFLQFPIFMAVYGAVRRFPYTIAIEGATFAKYNWAESTIFEKDVHSTMFGLDLFLDRNANNGQLVGIIILVILVCGTQFLSQFLSERRQKKNAIRQQEDIPAYRRQAYKSEQKQGQNTMKYVMYLMIFMMGSFVFQSKAGLGVYWLIGNLYSMLQMFINNEMGQRKLKKMRAQKSEYR